LYGGYVTCVAVLEGEKRKLKNVFPRPGGGQPRESSWAEWNKKTNAPADLKRASSVVAGDGEKKNQRRRGRNQKILPTSQRCALLGWENFEDNELGVGKKESKCGGNLIGLGCPPQHARQQTVKFNGPQPASSRGKSLIITYRRQTSRAKERVASKELQKKRRDK